MSLLININFVEICLFFQVKLTQGNLTFMPTQDSVASNEELVVARELICIIS